MTAKNLKVLGWSILALTAGLYFANAHLQIKKHGVFTVGKPTRFEPAEQGSTLYLDVLYDGTWYHTHVEGGYGIQIDSLYYVKILSTDPSVVDAVYAKVPSCISLQSVPRNGWAKVPDCKEN